MEVGDLIKTVSEDNLYFGYVTKVIPKNSPQTTGKATVYFPYTFNRTFDFPLDNFDVEVVDEGG